jgi:predicted ester cyclase
MSREENNKAIVGRWFTDFWGKTCNLGIVDELAAPDMLLQYSLHAPRKGHADIKAFMTDFRKAFPDLNFWGAADLIAEGDYVVGRWEGGGTHSGPAFRDFLLGSLPAATGRKMHFTGTTVLKLKDGKIVEKDRPGRRLDCTAAARTDQSRLITVHGVCTKKSTHQSQKCTTNRTAGLGRAGSPRLVW